jgi:hypothetical protein
VDAARVQLLRELLATTGWIERAREFAKSLDRPSAAPGSLLLVGTPTEEPWHLAAHLDDEARFSGVAQLSPTLVRWAPPPGAPPHLAVGLSRIEAARRGETLFVVAPDPSPEQLLERIADARRVGATVLSMDTGDSELANLAHDRLVVPLPPVAGGARDVVVGPLSEPPVDMDVLQHLVSLSAGEATVRPSLRGRLGRLLERVSGPAPRQ